MASQDQPPLSSSPPWSRMHSELENPFQNNPGRFIYALPDLRPSLSSHTPIGCLPDEPATCPPQRLPSVEPKDEGEEPPLWDESHFDPDIRFYLTQGEMEVKEVKPAGLRLRAKQRDDSSTPMPTPSSVSSSTASVESSSEKEKPEAESRPKRPRRRRRRIRPRPDHGGCVMGPRLMNIYGMHPPPWTHPVGSNSWGPGYYGMVGPSLGPWLLQPPISGYAGLFSS
ncbi:hypothetical protein BJV78DRAFT_1287106 [Lactifluus subvellereus]|nr:hypothetical protein BJV78DRAFT_1287106 [Lactifluus subvellereus]